VWADWPSGRRLNDTLAPKEYIAPEQVDAVVSPTQAIEGLGRDQWMAGYGQPRSATKGSHIFDWESIAKVCPIGVLLRPGRACSTYPWLVLLKMKLSGVFDCPLPVMRLLRALLNVVERGVP
jgi:hypothetical protein